MNKQEITNIVLEILNANYSAGLDTNLIGENALFDSMDLVGFIADVEMRFMSLGHPITLTSDKAMSLANSPFKTPRTLIEFIETKL
jgi:acyl carrier protein